MFDLDALDLESLIKTIDESGISEFCLTTPDGEIRVSKSPGGAARVDAPAGDQTPAGARADASAGHALATAPPTEPATADNHSGNVPVAVDSGPGAQIKTPMLGVFYRTPEPGAPPFVEVGSRVGPDTTVAIIEAMKVFTAVQAGTFGTIRAVLVQDRQFVEYDQALFVVEPDAEIAG